MSLHDIICSRTVRRGSVFNTAAVCITALLAAASAGTLAATTNPLSRPILLADQGERSYGGTILGDFATASIHCDHGYVGWQIPLNPRKLPMLMWHSSSTKTWSKTFNGSDGYQNIFLRRGFPVYIIDPPRLGRAGWSCKPYNYVPDVGRDQRQVISWRLGLWDPPAPPQYWPGVQFPVDDPDAIDEVLRARYPEFGDPDAEQVETTETATLLSEIGPAIVITHSGSGIRGWWLGVKSDNVKAIIAYEPSNYLFPAGEMPAPLPRADGAMVAAGQEVPMETFLKLTKMPIQIIYGDNIPDTLDPINVGNRLALDTRRLSVVRARLMADAINAHGGDAEVVELPDLGIYGNTHFPMSDLNNVQIADLLSKYLNQKGLDKR